MKKDEYEFIAHTPRGAVERSTLAKHAWQMRLTNTNMCMHILAQTCTETVPINYYQAWPNAFGLVLIKVSPDYVCVFFYCCNLFASCDYLHFIWFYVYIFYALTMQRT